MPSVAEVGVGIVAAALLTIGIGYLARITGAGQGLAELGKGFGTGLGAALSPNIQPTIFPHFGMSYQLNLGLGGNIGEALVKKYLG